MAPPTQTLGDGRKTVTSAGTREQLSATSVECTWVYVTAETDNTNPVTVGGATVVGALATRRGTPLAPFVATHPATVASSVLLAVNDLQDVWLDVVTNGEGVTYTYGTLA